MAHPVRTVHIDPGSELGRALAEGVETEVELERDGVRYRVYRVTTETQRDIWAGYDPERALAGVRAAAGSWSDIDADELKSYLREARESGSRSSDRP
jgi:hypothetical protein